MAARKAIIRRLDSDGQPAEVIGQMIDDGVHPPYGTTPAVDSMLTADRDARFVRYYLGDSNGYTYASTPDVAESDPTAWRQFLDWAWDEGRGATPEAKADKLAQMAGAHR